MRKSNNDTPQVPPPDWLQAATDAVASKVVAEAAYRLGAMGAEVFRGAFEQSKDVNLAGMVLAAWLAVVMKQGLEHGKEQRETPPV